MVLVVTHWHNPFWTPVLMHAHCHQPQPSSPPRPESLMKVLKGETGAHRAACVILVVAHEDIPIRMLLQFRWQADSHGPKQAVRLILRHQLCQEHIPRCVVLLQHTKCSVS